MLEENTLKLCGKQAQETVHYDHNTFWRSMVSQWLGRKKVIKL